MIKDRFLCPMEFWVALTCVILLHGTAATGQRQPETQSPRLSGPQVEGEVFEGVGFAGVEFGDSVEFVEDALGPAERGSESYRGYPSSGFTIFFHDGRAHRFEFDSRFRGALSRSGLHIGSRLEDFDRAYGAVEKSREVSALNDWQLDRTLLTLKDQPADPKAPTARLYYYDVGIFIDFDAVRRAQRVVIFKHTGFADDSGPGGRAEGRFVEEPVSESGEFAGVRFGDTRERAIEVLGEPISQDTYFLRYPPSRFSVHIRGGKVDGFLFDEGFRGKLVRSKLEVGASLDEVQAAFEGFHIEDAATAGELPGGPLHSASLRRIDNFGPDLRAQFHSSFRDCSVIFSINEQNTVRAFRMFRAGR